MTEEKEHEELQDPLTVAEIDAEDQQLKEQQEQQPNDVENGDEDAGN